MTREDMRRSKLLSKILRHEPETFGVILDSLGWANIPELITAYANVNINLTRSDLERLVAEDNKVRYEIDTEANTVRARYGHSIEIEQTTDFTEPPDILFHGTAKKFIASIEGSGIKAQKRQYVHLSEDTATAYSVGRRHGTPVILEVDAATMSSNGYKFIDAGEGLWLIKRVPKEFIIKNSS